MSYSILSQSLKNPSINIGISKRIIPLSTKRINQISLLSTYNTNKIIINNLKEAKLLQQNNNSLILHLQKPQPQQRYIHSYSNGLFIKEKSNLFEDNIYLKYQSKKLYSTDEENNNEKKDIDPNTFKWTSNSNTTNNNNDNNNIYNNNNNNSINNNNFSSTQNDSNNKNNRIDDVWNRKSKYEGINNINSNVNDNNSLNDINKKMNKRHKKRNEKKVEVYDDLYQLYTAIKERTIGYLNNLPSTLDCNSHKHRHRHHRRHHDKIINSESSPFLLWSTFMCASSFSSWLFRQITNSSMISTAVLGGITLPAIINFSHLFSHGGKIVAKELGAKECPTTSQLYEVVEEMAKKGNLSDVPTVYVHPSEEINALSAGIKSNESILMLTTGLLNNLSQDEIKAIIAHILYNQKKNFTGLGTHLTAMISGFYAPYNFTCYLRKCIIEYKQKKPNSLILDVFIGLSSLGIYLTKLLTGISYIAQSAFVRYREKQPIPRELMTISWKSAIRKLYNQPSTEKSKSLIWTNPSFAHLFLCDGKGEGWEKAEKIAENYEDVSKDLQNGKFWKKKNVRSVAEYFSIFPSLKKRSEWTNIEADQ